MNTMLEMKGISKSFPGVNALTGVSLSVEAGEIHALVGENGAGKSTLMKVLSGVYPHGSFEGEILLEGKPREFDDISDSESAGVIIVHQELALVAQMSIRENLFLGQEPARLGVIDSYAAHARARALLAKVGLAEDPETLVDDLGVGKQQLVEIAKALARDVRILILDEPTASLGDDDSAALLELLREFRRQGIACILISHKLNEVLSVADRITVLRDGRSVARFDCHAATPSEDEIIGAMVGRALAERYPARSYETGEPLFEVRGWWVHHPLHPERAVVKGVGLTANRGEIVGIAGLVGAGRTELAMSLFGRSYGRHSSGEARVDGSPVDISTVRKAILHGLAYVPEDRKGAGLLLEDPIDRNITLARLEGVSRRGVVDAGREFTVADAMRERLAIRCAGLYQPVGTLSGGNQQKVMIAKWLFTEPAVLLLDEPTRGIDVGAKYEIYSLVSALAAQGRAIVMISSEMPELLGMCDRIYVMSEGRFVAHFPRAEASQERIMQAIVRS
jgi:putative multiple sugar transport system ATP-binding protein